MGKKAKNMVIAGDYEGYVFLDATGKAPVSIGLIFKKSVPLTKETVESYELIDNSLGSKGGIVSGAVGAALLGPIGLLAGIPRAVGINLVAVKMKDGKNFLLEIDDKKYRSLIKYMY
jgi:hypothetical protein